MKKFITVETIDQVTDVMFACQNNHIPFQYRFEFLTGGNGVGLYTEPSYVEKAKSVVKIALNKTFKFE